MSDNGTVDSWVGRRVSLWPGDTYPRHADVLSVDAYGWEFEIIGLDGLDKSATKPGYRVGDRFYVSHSKPLTMAELDEEGS